MKTDAIQSIVSALPMPAVVISDQGRIVAMNNSATVLLGAGGIGRHHITAIRQPRVLDVIEQTFEDGQARTESFLTRDNDRDTTWKVSISAADVSPVERVIVVVFDDMTELTEAGQIRRDFVSNLSHELRTPLTAVMGFVETLRGAAREDPAARDRFLGIIEREAGRMAHLVDDLLSLSRVEDQERRRPVDPVDLPGLVRSVADVIDPLAQANNVTLVMNLPETTDPIPGDASQLRQVITNLIENAIKYGGPDKAVTVTLGAPHHEVTLQADAVRLSVTDQGEGIEAHHIPRLTERFYRLDSHRSRELGGTGLGLAIVKHIISRHRGRLRIESEMGQGSTFTVLLPVADQAGSRSTG